MVFWERFLELCNARKLKPNRIATEIGIASGTLSKWKEGKTFPNGETLIKISEYFGCSIDYLLGLSKIISPAKNEISSADIKMLEMLHSLPEDSQDEIIHMLNYKYEQYQKKRKRLSSTSGSTTTDNNNMLA